MAISAAVDALFEDPSLARDAIWRAGGSGAGIIVRAVSRMPDRISNFGGGRFVSRSRILEVRALEIPAPQAGDTFEIDNILLVVQGDPLLDEDGLIWTIETVLP